LWSRASDCLSAAACPQYCTDPDITCKNGRGCPLVAHRWADLQSVHGLRCYGNIARTRNITECLYSLYAWFPIAAKGWLSTNNTRRNSITKIVRPDVLYLKFALISTTRRQFYHTNTYTVTLQPRCLLKPVDALIVVSRWRQLAL